MEFYGRSRAALTDTTFSLPRAPQLTQGSPYTPSTRAQAPARGDSPQNPQPRARCAWRGLGSRGSHGDTAALPAASCLSPRQTQHTQGNALQTRMETTIPQESSTRCFTFCINSENFMPGERKNCKSGPRHTPHFGAKNQNPLIRCSTEVKPSVVRGSINSPSTAFSVHGKAPWLGSQRK